MELQGQVRIFQETSMRSPLLKRASSSTNAEGILGLIRDVGHDWLPLSECRERVHGVFGESSDEVFSFLRESGILKTDSGCYFFCARGPLPDLSDIYEAAENLPKPEEGVMWLSRPFKKSGETNEY